MNTKQYSTNFPAKRIMILTLKSLPGWWSNERNG